MIANGISAMVVLGTSFLFIDSAKVESGQERQFWILARRMEFQNLIRSQNGWNSILANNAQMSCFAASASCAGVSVSQPLKLPIDTATNCDNKTVSTTACAGSQVVKGFDGKYYLPTGNSPLPLPRMRKAPKIFILKKNVNKNS